MPVRKNFLEYSPTWRGEKSSFKIRASVATQRSRKIVELVAPLLNDKYQRIHSIPSMTKELKPFMSELGKNDIQLACFMLEFAYKYLNASSDDERQVMLAVAESGRQKNYKAGQYRAVKCLFNDNILRWSDIERLAETTEVIPPITRRESEAAEPEPPKTEVPGIVVVERKTPEQIKEEQEAEKPTAPPLLQDLFTRLLADVTELGMALVATNQELQQVLHENARIYQEIAQQNFTRAEEQFTREETHLHALDRIVAAFPSIPELYKIKEKITAVVHPVVKQRMVVPDDWPREFTSEGGVAMEYQYSFLNDYYGLGRIDQLAVTEGLKRLAKFGRGYPSLQTKTISKDILGQLGCVSQTPVGAFYSRASRGIRFTWTRGNNRNTVFHNVVRRGDVGFSET